MNMPTCLRLLRQEIICALCLALARAGKSMAARMAMIAMTTSSSIRVNAPPFKRWNLNFDFRCLVMFQKLSALQAANEITFTNSRRRWWRELLTMTIKQNADAYPFGYAI